MNPDGEFEIIEKIRRLLGKPSSRVLTGVGDDAAVLIPPTEPLLITMDMLVEGIHFDLAFITPEELGARALAVNLSDIAAMAGNPLYALVSLGLAPSFVPFVERLYKGMTEMAKKYGVDIVGGNISRCPERSVIDVVLVGEACGRPVTRSGTRSGDRLGVTGIIGDSAAGLQGLKAWGRAGLPGRIPEAQILIEAHLSPKPRVKEAQALNRVGGLSALIDISDGLASEAHHLASASGLTLTIEQNALPVSAVARDVAKQLGQDPVEWALYGGEDYELLFTADPKSEASIESELAKLGQAVHWIGWAKDSGPKVCLIRPGGETIPIESRGWNHFPKG